VRTTPSLAERAARFAALGDPHRLAIVEELAVADRAPSELGSRMDIESNLLAHHIAILERAGLLERVVSDGDRRRRYLRLTADGAVWIGGVASISASSIVFVCTHNSARSQLAAALWNRVHPVPATSAGTHPAPQVHPKAVLAGAAVGVDLAGATPRALAGLEVHPDLVITVCDVAHEELAPTLRRELHWSLPDPARDGRRAAFDATVQRLQHRIERVAPAVQRAHPRRRRQPATRATGGISHA
jgi:ArsR family transcriptional regulator, arsenate/arsenite/antimonite-responsive transcriptional repressor / arsenate reductase (thioredoxin)